MSEKAAAEKPEPSPFEKMRALAQKVVHTSKEDVESRDREWREDRQHKAAQKAS